MGICLKSKGQWVKQYVVFSEEVKVLSLVYLDKFSLFKILVLCCDLKLGSRGSQPILFWYKSIKVVFLLSLVDACDKCEGKAIEGEEKEMQNILWLTVHLIKH